MIKTINDYIIIEPQKSTLNTGIVQLSKDEEKKMTTAIGKILVVQKNDILQIGDIIHYYKSTAFKILIDKKMHTVIRAKDVIAAISPDDKH
jgi:co-chaperonin GroES (HSP10)